MNGSRTRTSCGTRSSIRVCRRSLGVACLAAAAVIGLSACGGAATSRVASLAANTSGTSTSTATSAIATASSGRSSTATTAAVRGGNATRLVDEWATCMRSHGDPSQADPTIDAYGVINITIPAGSAAVTLANEVHAAADPCNRYMAAASAALRAANPVAPPPDQAELLKYVQCMRANGVPNYPYPTGNETSFQGTGVDPNSPHVERVNNLCGQKLHLPAWWVSGNGKPGEVSVGNVGPNGAGSPGNPPPCFYAKNGCGSMKPVRGSNG